MLNIFDVTDKTVLVTGSTRGLGYAFAEGFLKAGARVVVSSKTPKNVKSAVEALSKISGKVTGVPMDVTDPASIKAAIAEVITESGRLDVLINNAGIQRRAPFMEMEKSQFDEVLDANLSSVFSVSQAAAKAMSQTGGGSIINISSLNSFGARPTIANYCASKGGVNMLTRSMALELAGFNIRVNAIAPGYFLTDMTKRLADDKDFDAWVKSEVPLGRWGRPEELIGAAVFLASEASSYMNGQVLVLDGGWRTSL
jgi:gluconate 5-dehydrogenase